MLTLQLYDEERAVIREALELYLHAIKGEPYEFHKPVTDEERHFDEDAIRDIIMRFE
jgi:hypothetical protein